MDMMEAYAALGLKGPFSRCPSLTHVVPREEMDYVQGLDEELYPYPRRSERDTMEVSNSVCACFAACLCAVLCCSTQP